MEDQPIYDSIKPIFYTSQLFAFNLHSLKTKRKTFTTIFIPNLIYNAAFLATYSYAYVHNTILASYTMGPGQNLIVTVNNFETQFEFALSLFILLASWLSADAYFKLLYEVGKVDKILEEISVRTPSTKWISYAICCSNLGLMFLIVVMRLYITWQEQYNTFFLSYMIMFHLPKLICFIGLNHFVNLLMILRSRFKTINSHLATLNTSTSSTPLLQNFSRETPFLFTGSTNKLFLTVNQLPTTLTSRECKTSKANPGVKTSQVTQTPKMQNAFAPANSDTTTHPISLLTVVQTLKVVHDALCDRASELNVLFSVPTLMLVTSAFVRTTSELNNIARTVIDITEVGFHDMHVGFLYTNVSMVCLTLGHLVLMAAVCTFTNGEANYTPVLVHKLMTRTNDDRMTRELETFSLQLLHRKVQFTACGFFALDATILFAVVGGVTTYLIILIQFQLAKV